MTSLCAADKAGKQSRVSFWGAGLFLPAVVLFVLYRISLQDYLFFHSIVETFFILTAYGIFIFVWNSRRFQENAYFIILGAAYLFIGGLEMMHMFAYKGMGIFPGFGTNPATQLWVAARYFEAAVYLAAPFFIGKEVRIRNLLIAFGVIFAFLLVSVFYWKNFPVCFVEGKGLTAFKIISEYFIMGFFCASAAGVILKRQHFDSGVFKLLICSISLRVFAEFFFTVYRNPYAFPNLFGHLLTLGAIYLIYKATIEIGLIRPFTSLFINLRKTTEELKKSSERYKAIVEDQVELVCRWKPGGMLTFVNDAYCCYFGKGRDMLLGKSFLPGIVEEDKKRAADVFESMNRENPVVTREYRVMLPSGDIRWHLWIDRAIFDDQGRIEEYQSVGRDITAQKLIQEELRESEERFRMVIKNSPISVFQQDLQLRYQWIYNPQQGYSPNEVIGRSDLEFFLGPAGARIREIKLKVLETVAGCREEVKIIDGDEVLFYDLILEPLCDAAGRLVGITGVSVDITDMKKMQDALKLSEERYALAQKAGGIGSWDWDLASGRIQWLGEMEPLFGLKRGEFKETFDAFLEYIHPEDRQRVLDSVRAYIDRGEEYNIEHRIIRPDGSIRWGVGWGSVIRDEYDRPVRMIGVFMDITVRKEAEEVLKRDKETFELLVTERSAQLLEAQEELVSTRRLSDIGTLAATVAHELRNPLAAIKMAVHNIRRKAQNPLLDRNINNVEIKISESEQIINNLLFYSRIKTAHCEKVNIYDTLEESIASALERFKDRPVSLQRDFDTLQGFFLEVDLLQMKELFGNLLNNAFDAFSGSPGTIAIEGFRENGAVIVRIKDNGAGIDQESLGKVFDPFFTTKAKGTGLGLTVCHQIVRLHEGDIRIESEKNKGTMVIVALPFFRPYHIQPNIDQ
jgi:PAS domain S-box-containing protein